MLIENCLLAAPVGCHALIAIATVSPFLRSLHFHVFSGFPMTIVDSTTVKLSGLGVNIARCRYLGSLTAGAPSSPTLVAKRDEHTSDPSSAMHIPVESACTAEAAAVLWLSIIYQQERHRTIKEGFRDNSRSVQSGVL
jgi:hypothetical protein